MNRSTVNFFNTDSSGGSGTGGSVEVKQITKMNVTSPHETIIDIPFTNAFKKLPLEVLKMKEGTTGIVETLCDFDNSDEADFEDNKYTVFDGDMHLETDFDFKTQLTSEADVYSFNLSELDKFKKAIALS